MQLIPNLDPAPIRRRFREPMQLSPSELVGILSQCHSLLFSYPELRMRPLSLDLVAYRIKRERMYSYADLSLAEAGKRTWNWDSFIKGTRLQVVTRSLVVDSTGVCTSMRGCLEVQRRITRQRVGGQGQSSVGVVATAVKYWTLLLWPLKMGKGKSKMVMRRC